MNMLKKGPQLKLSEIKVPDFLLDLYYDLRERHLLPLVVLLLVAIVAAPILLGGSSSSSSADAGDAAIATPSVAQSSGTLVVAKSAPGLRDYRRRLTHLRAKNPFKQQYAGSEAAGTEVAGGSAAVSQSSAGAPSEESGGSFSVTSAPSTSTTNVTTGPISAGAGTTTKPQTRYATDTIDVRIVPVDSGGDSAESSKAQPSVRSDLPELTMLPDRATPVVVFMGASSDGKKALLLVSSDVKSIFGDGQCVVGTQVCQLLALEAGLPETFVYGPQGHTYRIEILKIDKALSNKPHRASLGKPKKRSQTSPQPGPKSPAATG
jgi:hypothetical protein